MPYISREDRGRLIDGRPETVGQLNYLITRLCIDWVDDRGLSYQSINDVLGALDAAAREFYERVALPYEIHKRLDNGDVYQSIVPGGDPRYPDPSIED